MRSIERPPSHPLDEYLVVECQLGKTEAFIALVRRWHGPLVVRAERLTKNREAARDVAQESWIGIVRGLPRLRDPGRFPAWAMSIVANKARDWIRRERVRRGAVAVLSLEERDEPAADHDIDRVRERLAGLEPQQRTLLRQYYLESRSVAEIASELGIPAGTVKSRLSNARNQLRRRLEED